MKCSLCGMAFTTFDATYKHDCTTKPSYIVNNDRIARQFERIKDVERALANGARYADDDECHPCYPTLVAARQIIENAWSHRLSAAPPADGVLREWLSRTADALHNAATELTYRHSEQADDYAAIAQKAWAILRTAAPKAPTAPATGGGGQCSFCDNAATTSVDDASDTMPACASCCDAWHRDPGFRNTDVAGGAVLRERICAGLRAWIGNTPDIDLSPRMISDAADYIIGQPCGSTTPSNPPAPSDGVLHEQAYGEGYEWFRNKWIGDHEEMCADLVRALVPRAAPKAPTAPIGEVSAPGADGLKEALQAVADAMLNGGDSVVGDFGWNITKLNQARPLIRAALADRAQGEGEKAS